MRRVGRVRESGSVLRCVKECGFCKRVWVVVGRYKEGKGGCRVVVDDEEKVGLPAIDSS